MPFDVWALGAIVGLGLMILAGLAFGPRIAESQSARKTRGSQDAKCIGKFQRVVFFEPSRV